MKLKILVVIQAILITFFWVFGYIKSREADKQKTRAEQLATNAIQIRNEAEFQAEKAALMVQTAQKALENCQANK